MSSNTRKGDISADPMASGSSDMENGGTMTISESATSTAATTTASQPPIERRSFGGTSGEVINC